MISVIVPVYNVERWLNRCIDSILSQTYIDFELLLIDDGSKDNSGTICDEYAENDSRVRVFHKPNGGVSSARNLGLDNAKGEWISFCDSDDYVDADWLECMIHEAVSDCDMVSCGFHYYKEDNASGDMIPVRFSGNLRDYIDVILQEDMFGSLWNKLFRRSIIESHNLRLDTNIVFREDEAFVLRYLTYTHRCSAVPVATYHYYMPDWNKYRSHWTDDKTFELMKKLCPSVCKLRLQGPYAIRTYRSYFDSLKSISKLTPMTLLRNLIPCVKYAYHYKMLNH